MKSRVVILILFISGLFGIIVLRLCYLQILPNSNLDRLKKNQYMTVVSLPSQRGKILDRHGEELASSVSAKSLFADPSQIKFSKALARKLAPYLGLSVGPLHKKLAEGRKFVWLKRQIDDETADEIKSWKEPGLGFIDEGRRSYPNQNLLSQVLGFVGVEGNGLEGLEKKYDSELRGEKQKILTKRDARGRPLIVDGQIFELIADGASLETTIDKELQYELEYELEDVTRKQQADKATGVIMDPVTGEILAIGSYPSFNPAKGTNSSTDNRRNRAIGDIFEPGSTFKIVAAAAALRTGRIQPNTNYFCENGKFQIGKHVIHEAEVSHGFGTLSLAEILEVSSNIGTTKVVFDVGQDAYRKMVSDFGFAAKTGVDLLGEATGLLATSAWPDHLFSNISFGQGVGVTALQIANAYSVVANGGKLMRPYLIKRIVDSDNNIVGTREPKIIRQVLTPKEASTLTLMLSGVILEGTGTSAKVDGYPGAGKTGTAQKVNSNGHGYMKGAYLASFAGFIPANNPQFTIYIVVDHPRKQYFGAQVAAPVFQRLASFALNKRGFLPIVVNENSLPKQSFVEENDSLQKKTGLGLRTPDPGEIPDFHGLTIREVAERINEFKDRPDIQLLGQGLVTSQIPGPGKPWIKTQKMKIYFGPPG